MLDLEHVLVCLGRLNIALEKLNRILSVPAIRRQCLFCEIGAAYFEVCLSSDVPVALAVEVDVAHVGAEHLRDDLAVLTDFADEIVLGAAPTTVWRVDLVPGSDVVLLIRELYLASDQVDQGTEDCVEELVLVRSVFDVGAVACKLNDFAALHMQVDAVEMRLGTECRVTIPTIQLVRTLLVEERNRRMVSNLFHAYSRPIGQVALKCLAKDRVERFVKDVTRMHEAERSNHHMLHALDGVLGLRSYIHVYWTVLAHRGDQVEDGVV